MNVQIGNVIAPVPPRTMADTGISMVMMRDILLKTMFRMNLETVSDISRVIAMPIPITQELIDLCRSQKLLEATGTLHANSGGEMGYQLADAGKARALDALAQSEYYGAMPVPLMIYREQVKRQSIRNIQMTRHQLTSAMGHLILPDSLLDHLGPAVGAGRSILMYGPPGNGKSSISNGIRDALGTRSTSPAPSNIRARSSPSTTRSCIPPPKPRSTIPTACAGPPTASTTATSIANARP